MRSPLLRCLLMLILLTQGCGGAWAATRMAAATVSVSASQTELLPCHRSAEQKDLSKSLAQRCCGTPQCPCLMSCGGMPALALAYSTPLFARAGEAIPEPEPAALTRLHYGPPLRPPASLLQL